MSISWEIPVIVGDSPCPRSGHSFTSVGDHFLLFGGVGRKGDKPQSLNDLYELDTSDIDEFKWKEVVTQTSPPPRARHAAIPLDEKQLLIFGGIDKRTRYNDVWIFSTEERAWSPIQVYGAAPEPRAHFTATKFGSKIIIFGGYGGSGQVFNDIWFLRVEDGVFTWEDMTASALGIGPTPRLDHSAFIYPITPNSDTYDKLVIMGGRDLSQMFQDSHMLDLNDFAWVNDVQPPTLPYEICNNVCDGIESVPYHKVFSFGGKKDMMLYTNTVEVMDCGALVWSTPPTEGTVKAPVAREDTAWIFDSSTCSLLIFGGWSNRWLGDLVKLNVSSIIGPPYACTSIFPDMGPVFGSTELTIKGLRLRDGKIQVKFSTNEKNEAVVDGTFVDNETIKVLTPNYEQYGALTVDVKVSISGEGWTVNKIRFSYFANTAARNCIAYGPGLLAETMYGVENSFLIQAKDTQNEKRTSGGDIFQVRTVSMDGKYEGVARIKDLSNGQYEGHYMAPTPGQYQIFVAFNELGTSDYVPIRGSPFTVTCVDPWVKHRVMGSTPARRKGLNLVSLNGDLVMYGGDKSGVFVCSTDGQDWKWSQVTASGGPPPDRSFHSSAVLSLEELALFGGVSVADGSDLNDLWYLKKQEDGSWSWSTPEASLPYTRHVMVSEEEEGGGEEAGSGDDKEKEKEEEKEEEEGEQEEGKWKRRSLQALVFAYSLLRFVVGDTLRFEGNDLH